MDFGLLLGFEWIVYSMLLLIPYLFTIYRPVTPPLGSMPLASSIVSVPSVGQLHQSGPGMATSWAPHTSSPLLPWGEAPLHTFAQPPTSTSTLGLILSPSSDPIPTGW